MMGGYMMLAIASGMSGSIGFMTACLAACLVGCSQTLGEIGNLAFFRSLPACILGAWGAGTGLAGISGGSVYVGLLNLNLTNQQIFTYLMPTAFVYYGCFSYLHYRAKQCGVFDEKNASTNEKNAELSWESLKDVIKYTWPVLINLVAVYTLEYIIYPGMVDRDTLCPISKGSIATSAYALMWTMYNVGVTISRVSISWFKIDNLWLITGLQALNLALWFVEANTHAILNMFGIFGYYVLFAWMIWVGLMGGSCYSNCMHAYNTSSSIPDKYRELGMNVGLSMVNLGILGGSSLTTLLQTTIMSSAALYPNGCPAPRFP
jgi:battenin